VNTSDVTVVLSQGGKGKEVVMAASDTNLISTIKPLTSQGYSMDPSGNLKPDLTVASSNISLPWGLFDYVVSLDTHAGSTSVIIIPSTSFTRDIKWYKLLANGKLVEYPHFQVDVSGNGILTLYDNDEYDRNPAMGFIRDQGGPGFTTSDTKSGSESKDGKVTMKEWLKINSPKSSSDSEKDANP